MKTIKFKILIICILPLVTSIIVLQRITDISDFLRGTLTGVCLGLQLMFFILLKKRKQLNN